MFNNSSTAFTMPVIPANYGYSNSGMGGFGGFGDSWVGLIIILALLGWGGNGFGGGFGGFGGNRGGFVEPCATQADVRAAVDQQTLISKLDQQTYGLADSTYALNNTITSGFHGVDNAICNLGYQTQSGFNALGAQLADCCCKTQSAIQGVNYNIATEICGVKHAMSDNTRDIIENQNNNTRSILDFLVNDKIATLTAENQSLKTQIGISSQNAFITANQEAQTAELLRRLAPTPTPAYVVPNPNCCYNAQVSFANGCGCGCGNF